MLQPPGGISGPTTYFPPFPVKTLCPRIARQAPDASLRHLLHGNKEKQQHAKHGVGLGEKRLVANLKRVIGGRGGR
jgi:hypothetical protein